MGKCKVILSVGESEILTFGELEIKKCGFTLLYEIDGDKCSAVFNDGVFTQKRSGSFNMAVRFAENQNSGCVISDGGLSGALDVFTKKLTVNFTDDGITVKLNYELGGEEKNINLTAVNIQEKK